MPYKKNPLGEECKLYFVPQGIGKAKGKKPIAFYADFLNWHEIINKNIRAGFERRNRARQTCAFFLS